MTVASAVSVAHSHARTRAALHHDLARRSAPVSLALSSITRLRLPSFHPNGLGSALVAAVAPLMLMLMLPAVSRTSLAQPPVLASHPQSSPSQQIPSAVRIHVRIRNRIRIRIHAHPRPLPLVLTPPAWSVYIPSHPRPNSSLLLPIHTIKLPHSLHILQSLQPFQGLIPNKPPSK